MKWPNDIYAFRLDRDTGKRSLQKIGGILVSSSYYQGEFTIVVGVGINVCNKHGLLSINELIGEEGGLMTKEELLATFMVRFEDMYRAFCESSTHFLQFSQRYYDQWLHR